MPGRRFFEIGRRLIQQGHQVTVITGNSELGLPLGRKKIGLLQKDGMAIVVFNLGCSQVKEGERKGINATFARRAARQGRRLPRPDLVLASSPPLATAGPAYSLSCFYEVPLIMEIRKIEAVPLDYRDSLWKRIFTPPEQRTALKAFSRAQSIIATSPGIAMTVAQITSPGKTVYVLPDELDFETLFQEFNNILTAMQLSKDKN
ncbi:MAG: glycosyltransferase [Dethiobacteria bacterium]|nr:glycosyltransferase [Bacillota bacterium]